MTNIQSPSLSGAAAAGKVGRSDKRGSSAAASSVMGTLSGRVAGSIGRALRLVEDEGEGGQQGGQKGGGHDDPYEIAELVEQLAKEIPASAVDVGRVSRGLHEFAHEVAALVMARPQSSSISYLQRLIADQDATKGDANMAELAAIIEKTTAKLQAG